MTTLGQQSLGMTFRKGTENFWLATVYNFLGLSQLSPFALQPNGSRRPHTRPMVSANVTFVADKC